MPRWPLRYTSRQSIPVQWPPAITEVYAEKDEQEAVEAMMKVG